MTARETLTTTLTNLLARTRNGRMDAHRAEAERLVYEALREQAHELAESIRHYDWDATVAGVPCCDDRTDEAADLIDPAIGFDTLIRASEQRADEKRKARAYPYDLEVGQ